MHLQFTIKTKLHLTFKSTCTPVVNASKIPSVLTSYTESLLESFYFFADHIADVIKKLDLNKAHGYDMISIRMLKCGCTNPHKK